MVQMNLNLKKIYILIKFSYVYTCNWCLYALSIRTGTIKGWKDRFKMVFSRKRLGDDKYNFCLLTYTLAISLS